MKLEKNDINFFVKKEIFRDEISSLLKQFPELGKIAYPESFLIRKDDVFKTRPAMVGFAIDKNRLSNLFDVTSLVILRGNYPLKTKKIDVNKIESPIIRGALNYFVDKFYQVYEYTCIPDMNDAFTLEKRVRANNKFFTIRIDIHFNPNCKDYRSNIKGAVAL